MSTFLFRKRADHDETEKKTVGKGVFRKCAGCEETLPAEELSENFEVCPRCQHHHPLAAEGWRRLLLDDPGADASGTSTRDGEHEPARREEDRVGKPRLAEWDADLVPTDPLGFSDGKPYAERVKAAQGKGHGKEAMEIGRATLDGHAIAYGAFLFSFMGGSMGSVVGEKVTRLFERATRDGLPVVLLHASGGARMQEGILSLMQMAKGVAARERLKDARLPFLSVLLNPTTGGVAASFALLGDVNIAEPNALIGFAGPRVIESTIRQKLPEGFQRAEFLLQHGMVDRISSRLEMRRELSLLLGHLTRRPQGREGPRGTSKPEPSTS